MRTRFTRLSLGLCLALLAFQPAAAAPAVSSAHCQPLPLATGALVYVDTVPELQSAVSNLESNTTILIADGVYTLTNVLNIRAVNNVTLRGASGNRDAVVVRGQGMTNSSYGNVPHVVALYDANDVLLADLTLRDAWFHLVQVHGEDGPQRPRFRNLRLIDSGEQFIKGSTNPGVLPRLYSDGGVVECSLFEYTDRARSDYTNAVDVLAGADWVIRDNVFRNIRAPVGQLAGPAILMWRNSLNTVVERNQFIECDRAIALGLSEPDGNSRGGNTTYDHQGGVIRNNFIYRAAGAATGDVGITVNYAANYAIHHNTVVLNDTFPWTIEYRFSVSSGGLAYNLTDGPILQRNDAQGTLTGNLTNAALAWFANPAAGDLHLTALATPALDQAAPLAAVADDYDGHIRATPATLARTSLARCRLCRRCGCMCRWRGASRGLREANPQITQMSADWGKFYSYNAEKRLIFVRPSSVVRRPSSVVRRPSSVVRSCANSQINHTRPQAQVLHRPR